MSSFVAPIVGAGIGFSTQDPMEHPLSAIIGAAAGGYAASLMTFRDYIKPVAKINAEIDVLADSKESYSERVINKLLRLDGRLKGYERGIESSNAQFAKKSKEALEDFNEHIRVISANIDTVMKYQTGAGLLNGNSLMSPEGKDAIRSWVNANSSNQASLKMLFNTMNFDTSITVADIRASASIEQIESFKVGSKTNAADAENLIREHLINKLGHGGALAHEAANTAKIIAGSLEGFEYTVDHNLTISTSSGKEVIPLTMINGENGTKFSLNGTTGKKSAVMSYNPFGWNYTYGKNAGDIGQALIGKKGLLDAKDVLKQLNPETLLAFLDKDGNKERSLSKIASEIRSLHRFVPADGMAVSDSRKVIDSQIYLGYKSENGRLQRVKTISTSKNADPEMRVILKKLAESTGSNIFNGVSQNALGVINSGKTNFMYPGLFPAMERGGDSVLERGYLETGNDSTRSHLSKLIGADEYKLREKKYATVRNAIPLRRLDASEEVARFANTVLGERFSLDDGAGLYKDSVSSKLSATQKVTFKFSSIPGNPEKFPISEVLLNAINGDNVKLLPNEAIGFDSIGNEVKLGREYSDAKVISHRNIDGILHVGIEAKYEPDGWIKIFSQSSKAGLTDVNEYKFEKIAMLEMAKRNDLIRFEGNYTIIDNKTGNKIDGIYSSKVSPSTFGYYLGLSDAQIEEAKKVDFMLRSSDTGASLLYSAISNDDAKLNSELVKFKDSKSPSVQKAVEMAKTGKETQKVAAALFLGTISDGKANSDMLLTMIDNISPTSEINRNALGFLRNIMHNRESIIGSEDAMDNILRSAIIAAPSVKNGSITTLASVDLGESIHGSGNAGRISWLEQKMLRSNGWTAEDLEYIGTHNTDATFELSMIEARTKLGTDYTAQKYKYGSKIVDAMYKRGDARKEAFNLMDMHDNGKGYIHYRLQTSGSGIRSVAIPLTETNWSGFLDLEGEELIKKMDKAKINLVDADIKLANEVTFGRKGEGYKLALENFNEAARRYNETVNSTLSGDNNIIKSAMRMDSDVSRIHTLRSAGSDFAKFVEEQMRSDGGLELKPYVLMSEAAIEDFAGKIGDDIILKSIPKYPHLKRAYYKNTGNPVVSLISREPAQGPLSSHITEIIIDSKNKKDINHVFVPKIDIDGIKNITMMYQLGDFDADHVRLSLLGNMPIGRVKELFGKQQEMLKTATDVALLQKTMGAKGTEFGTVTVADFANQNAYNEFLSAAGQKGRVRKEVAAFATDISVNMNAALDKHYESLGLSDAAKTNRSMVSRSVIHNIVESLIKTQHKETNVANMDARTEIEQFIEHQKQYLNGSISRGEFDQRTKSMIMSMVGDKVEASNLTDNVKNAFNSAVDDIVSATGSHARTINFEGWEQIHGRFGQNASPENVEKYLDSLKAKGMIPSVNVASNADIIDNVSAHITGGTEYAKNFIYENKRALMVGGAALAATATFLGSERPEPSKDILPSVKSAAILPPLPDQKGYVSKGRDYRDNAKSYTIRASNQSGDPRQKSRELFNNSSNRVIIQDKRER